MLTLQGMRDSKKSVSLPLDEFQETVLRSGAWRFTLQRDATSAPEALRFHHWEDAHFWLRRMALEPGQLAALRRFFAEGAHAGEVALVDDEEVLRRLALQLVAGRVQVVERLERHDQGGGDAATKAVAADAATATEVVEPRPAREAAPERTWITIRLVGEDDAPIPGERYRIDLPDGSVREGRLDVEGLARVRGIEPGQCTVTFPDLDQEAWVPIGTSAEP